MDDSFTPEGGVFVVQAAATSDDNISHDKRMQSIEAAALLH